MSFVAGGVPISKCVAPFADESARERGECGLGTFIAHAKCALPYTPATTGKENVMIRTILSLVVLAAFTAVMAGCHASATVDPHGSTSITAAR